MRTLRAIVLLALAMAAAAAQAQDPREAEQRLQKVRSELKAVASERRKLEGARGDATRQLRQADEQVGSVQRNLRGIEATLQRDSETLAQLQAERATHAGDLDASKAELARLLRAAQLAGADAPLKAMLAQDRIAEAERALAYQGYLQRGRVQRIRELGAELARIDALEREIGQRQAALAQDREQHAAQLAQLALARKQRAGVLAGIDRQYQDKAGREQALGRDAKALQGLLAQLRAAAAKAAREAAKPARRRARRQQPGQPSPKRTPVASAPAMKVGGLGWPVAGSLLAAYGGALPDGRRSDGVLIAAPAGSTVKAVADGTVVFADWMTGYGNILIIDHGNGYMSLYAHNDGLLREAGDAVRRGDAVASVGTSGGQGRPALYFELRRNGAPVNPGTWLTRQ
ncbi:MAG: peptidoglycan DD-metalloendopeptidase family protein [Thermomonas sp.]|nr:peptidoglycan DD-metalloendopeptidase family protein [Thermomonas sp.]